MSRNDTMKRRAAFNVAAAIANLSPHIHEGEGHNQSERRDQRRRALLRGADLLTTLLRWAGSDKQKGDAYAIAVRRPAIVLAAGYTHLLSGKVPTFTSRVWLSATEIEALALPASGGPEAVKTANEALLKAAEWALTIEDLPCGRTNDTKEPAATRNSTESVVWRATAIVQRISQLPGLDARTRYNLACFYATLSKRDALAQLRLAVASSHALAAWAADDPSLQPLKKDPQFKKIVNPSTPKSTTASSP